MVAEMPDFKAVTQQVESSVSDWENGRGTLASTILQALEGVTNQPGTVHMVLVCVFESLVTSALESKIIVEFYDTLVEGLPEEGRDSKVNVLTEALADGAETVNEESYKNSLSHRSGIDPNAATKAIEVLAELLASSRLPRQVANLVLSPELLDKIKSLPPGLTPSRIDSLRTKANTQSFYKLPLFNLLRESSEGYALIITLLTSESTLDPLLAGVPDSRETQAREVWSNINSLIGYYGLAPARVLDLILEVASCQLADHWRFFLSLVKASPWGSSPYHGNQIETEGMDNENDEDEGALDRRTLIRVISAKFRLFQRPTLDSGADLNKLPLGFVYFVAILIKHAFLTLDDILGAITPNDEGMAAIYEKWEKSMSSGSGSVNKLALAGALVDDDAPTNGDANESAQANAAPLKPPPEHRIILLQALLAIGDLEHASYLISRYPWVVQTHAPIADLVMRNVNYSLEPVYSSIQEARLLAAPKGPSRGNIPVAQTMWVPAPPDSLEQTYEFFYPDWNNGLPQWTSTEELIEQAWPVLGKVRSMAIRNNQAIIRICRIGARYFETLRKAKKDALGYGKADPKDRQKLAELQPTQGEMEPWIRIIRLCLLPALSVSQPHNSFDVELWAILKHFPYRVRHILYRDWRDNTCRTAKRGNPCLSAAHATSRALSEAKSVLKNITSQKQGTAGHEDVRAITTLTNIGRSNPLPLWERALYQIKSYANIGEHIVASARNMGFLSMDVAAFVILDELDNPKLERANVKGTVAAHLENIATFVAQFNRRYRMMELEPVLDFIVSRINAKRYDDLVILDQIMTLMVGSTRLPDDAFSDDQLRAFAAGDELQRESITQTNIGIIKRLMPDDPLADAKRREALKKPASVKNSLPKLVEALKDPNFGIPIFVGLAKTYQNLATAYPHAQKNARLGQMDVIRHIIHQYADTYAAILPEEYLISSTPPLSSLVLEEHVDIPTAFKIVRPVLRALFARESQALAARSETKPAINGANGDAASNEEDIAMAAEDLKDEDITTESGPLQEAIRDAEGLLKPDVALTVRAPYFVTFWHLTLRDVEHSSEAYEKEIKRLRLQASDVGSWRDVEFGDPIAERDRLKARADQLEKEKVFHAKKVAENLTKLEIDSQGWFASHLEEKSMQSALTRNLVEECFIPRAVFGPEDAVFVAKFIGITHNFAPSHFSTAAIYARILGPDLEGWLSSCTNNEARNLGRFLRTILDLLDEWHSKKKKYEEEALGQSPYGRRRTGFMLKLPGQDEPVDMSWEMFRNYFAKRHETLSSSIANCLRSDDPMRVKNALIISLQIMRSFPVMEPQGVAITEAVEYAKKQLDGMQYPDVLAQLNGYQKQLESSRKRAMAIKSFNASVGESDTWLTPTRFHQNGRKSAQELQRFKAIEVRKRKAVEDRKRIDEERRKATEAKAQAKTAAAASRASARVSGQPSTPARPARPDAAEIKARTAKAMNESVGSQASGLPAKPGDATGPSRERPVRPEARSSAAPTGPSQSRHASPNPSLPVKPGSSTPARQPSSTAIPTKPEALKAERESAQQSRFANLAAPVPPSGPSASRSSTRNAPFTPAANSEGEAKRRPVTPPLPSDDTTGNKDEVIKRPESRTSTNGRDETSRRDASWPADKRPTTPDLPGVDKAAPGDSNRSKEEQRPKAREEQSAIDNGRSSRGGRARDGDREELKRKRDDEAPRRGDDNRDRDRERTRDERRESRDERRDGRRGEHRSSRRDDRDDRDKRSEHRHRRDRSRDSERSRRDRPDDLRRDRDGASSRRSSPDAKDRSEREARAARFGGVQSADDRDRRNGDRHPVAKDGPGRPDPRSRELLPQRAQGDRIIEAPRSTRAPAPRPATDSGAPARQPHNLPVRPGRPVTPPLENAPNLAARLGPSHTAGGPAGTPRNGDDSPNGLKRRSDDEPRREESPAEGAKRPKLDRSRLRRMM